ncbi:MAG: NAD(P)/FAD-dependent oxidoreductase [Dehalococcoidia bacterium]
MPDSSGYDAVVVGSGPNGLAAAITLARQGRSVLVLEAAKTVGGGLRSEELLLEDCVHDIGAAVHPLGLASPFFRSLPLEDYGVEWIHSPAPLAHPLDDGTAVLLKRSLKETAAGLGADGQSYHKLMAPLVRNWEELLAELMGPPHLPRHPLDMLRFAVSAFKSADRLARRRFEGERARALFGGLAAHSVLPLEKRGTAAFGLMFGSAAHAVGWPIAKGGSKSIAAALADCLTSLGGEIRTETLVRSLQDIPPARTVLFDVTPRQLSAITGAQFPESYRRRLNEHRYGPGVFKMDWVLDGPVPWQSPECAQSATVHLGGSLEEIAAAESEIWRGRHPGKPLVIAVQPSLFDPNRAPEGKHILWAYCHVPNGSDFDMSERIEAQIERFAPGFRRTVLARHVMAPADLQAYNPNCVGGDIAGGIQDIQHMLLRPAGWRRSYAMPAKGWYICSSSAPPGAGVHGMCGFHAAKIAIKEMF